MATLIPAVSTAASFPEPLWRFFAARNFTVRPRFSMTLDCNNAALSVGERFLTRFSSGRLPPNFGCAPRAEVFAPQFLVRAFLFARPPGVMHRLLQRRFTFGGFGESRARSGRRREVRAGKRDEFRTKLFPQHPRAHFFDLTFRQFGKLERAE
jgi:hypothetical protein